jgi:hypothetical protein
LGLRVSGIPDVCGAFFGAVLGQDFTAGGGDGFVGSSLRLSQQGLEFGEDLLDRIEIGRVFREEYKSRPGVADCLPHGLSLVRAEIVEDDDVAWLEGRDEELLDIGAKAFAVDGSVEQAGRINPIVAQRSEECCGLPVALRDLVDEPLPFWRPAPKAGHVRLRPGLVDEDQALGVYEPLIGSPTRAMPSYVRAILLLRDEGLFLNVTPIRRKKRLIIEVSALTPRSTKRRSQSD